MRPGKLPRDFFLNTVSGLTFVLPHNNNFPLIIIGYYSVCA